MPSNKEKQKALFHALLSAFPTRSDLERVVLFGLGKNLAEISLGSNLEEVVFDLIRWCEARNRLRKLYFAALDENPENPRLQNLFIDIGLSLESFSYDDTLPFKFLISSPEPIGYDPEKALIWKDRHSLFRRLRLEFMNKKKFNQLCITFDGYSSENVAGKTIADKIVTLVANAEKYGNLHRLKAAADRVARDNRTDERKKQEAARFSREAKLRRMAATGQRYIAPDQYNSGVSERNRPKTSRNTGKLSNNVVLGVLAILLVGFSIWVLLTLYLH